MLSYLTLPYLVFSYLILSYLIYRLSIHPSMHPSIYRHIPLWWLNMPQVQRLFPNFPHLFHLMSHMELHHATGWPKMEIVTSIKKRNPWFMIHERDCTPEFTNMPLETSPFKDVSVRKKNGDFDIVMLVLFGKVILKMICGSPRFDNQKTCEISFMSERNHPLIIGSVVCSPRFTTKKKTFERPKKRPNPSILPTCEEIEIESLIRWVKIETQRFGGGRFFKNSQLIIQGCGDSLEIVFLIFANPCDLRRKKTKREKNSCLSNGRQNEDNSWKKSNEEEEEEEEDIKVKPWSNPSLCSKNI